MVHAFTLLLILLFLMPYASLIPMTCLASILMIVGYNMSGWRTVGRMIKRAPKGCGGPASDLYPNRFL